MGTHAVSCAKMTEPNEMPFGTWIEMGAGKCTLDEFKSSHVKGQF